LVKWKDPEDEAEDENDSSAGMPPELIESAPRAKTVPPHLAQYLDEIRRKAEPDAKRDCRAVHGSDS
jgi:hypothetical protein